MRTRGKLVSVQAERYEEESVSSRGEKLRDFVVPQGLKGVCIFTCVRETTGSRERRAA